MTVEKRYQSRNALVTGATGGIGTCIAERLSREGCNVLLTARNTAKLDRLASHLVKYGSIIEKQAGDLRNQEDLNTVISAAKQIFPHIDILINCAGLFTVKPVVDTTEEDLFFTYCVNIRAPFLLSRAFIPDMVKRGWGRIVNIGSSSSYKGFKNTSAYCLSKHALLGFSRALHDELKNNNIRVFCVSPGSVKTEMGRMVKDQDFNTFIQPDDVAEYVLFIMSFEGEIISEEILLNRMVVQ